MIIIPPPPPRVTPAADYAVCDLGDVIRLDLYGEPIGDRVVAFLTPEQAMNLSRVLGRAALRVG